MKTLVIKIDKLQEGPPKGYPIHLHIDEGDDPGWLNNPKASGIIPEALSLADPPLDPADNQPLDAGKVRQILLNQGESSPQFKAIGQYLFRLLSPGQVGQAWKHLRQKYPREQPPDEGLRTILHIEPRKLRLLPWELICDGPRRLFIDPVNPVIRACQLDFAQNDLPLRWPVKTLVVVGCRADDPQVKADDEVLELETALKMLGKLVDWEVLYRPSKKQLTDKFKEFEPYIFHFIGHGKKSLISEQPILEFYDQAADNHWEWGVDDIVNDLAGWTPRFAFINACRSSDPTDQENAWAITDAFVEAGIPAVLGMQADVRGEAAAKFAGGVYCALARGESLDCALAEGRKEILNLPGFGLDRRDWALASLLLSTLPENILPMKLNIPDNIRRQIEQCPEFVKIRDFVNRKVQRRSLMQGVDPLDQAKNDRDLLVVVGDDEVGKTALVHWCMEGCMLQGQNLIYVEVDDGTSKNFLDVLRLIRDGDPLSNSPIRQPLKREAFYPFNRRLNELLGDRPGGGPGNARAADDDAGYPFKPGPETLVKQIFAAFRTALVNAADGKPLIIALDHLSRVSPFEFSNYLRPHFIDFISRHDLSPVRMLLVLRDSEYKDFQMHLLEGSFELIKVNSFKKDEFTPLAREFFNYYGVLDKAQKFIAATEENIGNIWTPKLLRELHKVIKMIG